MNQPPSLPDQQQQQHATNNNMNNNNNRYIMRAKLTSAKALSTLLSTVLLTKKTRAKFQLMDSGIKVIVHHESKSFQCTAFLRKSLFQSYHYSSDLPMIEFELQLCDLIDCLNFYGSAASGTSVFMSFPGIERTLSLLLSESSHHVMTDCGLRTSEVDRDMVDYVFDPQPQHHHHHTSISTTTSNQSSDNVNNNNHNNANNNNNNGSTIISSPMISSSSPPTAAASNLLLPPSSHVSSSIIAMIKMDADVLKEAISEVEYMESSITMSFVRHMPPQQQQQDGENHQQNEQEQQQYAGMRLCSEGAPGMIDVLILHNSSPVHMYLCHESCSFRYLFSHFQRVGKALLSGNQTVATIRINQRGVCSIQQHIRQEMDDTVNVIEYIMAPELSSIGADEDEDEMMDNRYMM